ncbi:TIGR03557 family F420-dependent LLM class oxidoreductase [Nocardiopsis lambiniae]|uniref:TIGR03557 family F420-dependent LLM class oxidoreductase n=1 Tax=Nocardiopsis lambiniae TaxID=3075539 RepID=A0ABU2MAI9_9ACTN|nr:TIGR03557 family F420-dependent LLM class oxidoreductase [Nocardiopsis sp. DSM 44743]MDT0329547.1 TIGR03557 family F420-dependent LLM class oxidoreductase [Nocardiopsis sp. DSM 44743]
MEIGFKLMAERYEAPELVRQAVRAEELGFDFVEISDHYHPWLFDHGHSPFAWSVMAAIAQATERIRIGPGVTCPSMRYHPAIVAQMSATTAVLSGGRHFLGVGSGERLNEHVVGDAWPSVTVRHAMLRESLEIIRALWTGGYHSYEGEYLTLDDARVFDLPETAPEIIVAAGGERAAALAAELGDGLFATEPEPELVEAYTAAGGDGPRYVEVPLAIADDVDTALRNAWEGFRFGLSGWKVMSELPNPINFEAATALTRAEDMRQMASVGPDPQEHLKQVRTFSEAGFDHLVLMNAGADVEDFFAYAEENLLPELRSDT